MNFGTSESLLNLGGKPTRQSLLQSWPALSNQAVVVPLYTTTHPKPPKYTLFLARVKKNVKDNLQLA